MLKFYGLIVGDNNLFKVSDKVASVDDNYNNAISGIRRQLITIPHEDSRLPVILLTNINHFSNKLDELYVY